MPPAVSHDALGRFSLNQMTTQRWTVAEAIDGCLRADIPYIGLWREKVSELGVAHTAKLLRETGLRVSSLCRGGFFPAPDNAAFKKRLEENLRAVDEAAELGASILVLVCGGLGDQPLATARKMVREGIATVVPYAQQRGVKLAIEPLHPMFAADRSVITTLKEANDLALDYAAHEVGVIADVYHIWWDPSVYTEISRAGAHLSGFHVSDWIIPLPDILLGRGMMGDGVIDLNALRKAVEQAGYSGPIETEIFNQTIWDTPGDEVLELAKRRYVDYVFVD